MCDQRMEQLRKRFDSGLDITELLMDDKMEEQQTEVIIVTVYILLSVAMSTR